MDTLQCRVGLNPQHLQSLHIKVTPLPEAKDQWTSEELQVYNIILCLYFKIICAIILDN